MNQSFQETGFYPADILLPNVRDMRKWAVIACDQFTSQPAYWQKVERHPRRCGWCCRRSTWTGPMWSSAFRL